MKDIHLLLLALLTSCLFVGCGAPKSTLTESQEYYVGRAVSANFLARYPLHDLKDKGLWEYINLVGLTLSEASERPVTFHGYHFAIVDSDEINAFATPSGFIFITTGTLKAMKTEDQLAGVLAHEITHVALQHPELMVNKAKQTRDNSNVMRAVINFGISLADKEHQRLWNQAMNLFDNVIDDTITALIDSGYSRDQEYDADLGGFDLMIEVGYNPNAMNEFLSVISSQKKTMGWLSDTHPTPTDRIERLTMRAAEQASMPQTQAQRTTRFRQATKHLR